MKKASVLLFVILAFVFGANANALLIDLGPGSFSPLAPPITFDLPYGTFNPVYDFFGLEGLGDMTVSFGGHFVGQSVNITSDGGFTLDDNIPDGPLALDPHAPPVFTALDAAVGDANPILTGYPLFNGVISILFSKPVANVGLTGGSFNEVGGTTIEAYGQTGELLGSITNTELGFESYGLADSTGANVIAGISLYIANEPGGFGIDNLTFGVAGDIPNIIPEPTTLFLFGVGLIGLLAVGRKGLLKK